MRVRWGLLMLAGWGIAGCGPPDMVPMTPPGVSIPRVSEDTSEALGEQNSRVGVQPPSSSSSSPTPANPGATPAEPPKAP